MKTTFFLVALSSWGASVSAQVCSICGDNGTLLNPDTTVSLPVLAGQSTSISCKDLDAGLNLLTPPFEEGGPCLAGIEAAQSAGCQCDGGVPTAAPTAAATTKAPVSSTLSLTAPPVGGRASSVSGSEQESGVATRSLAVAGGIVASVVVAMLF